MTTMDAGAKGWLVQTARKNLWRVPDSYELRDLVQDGYWHWARIVHRYEVMPNRIRSRKHLMGLFKITFINHVNDLSKRKSRMVEVAFDDLPPAVTARMQYSAAQDLIGLAPPLVKLAFVAIMSDDGARRMRSAYRVYAGGARETLNERLCRLTGLDPKVFDLPDEMKRYLHGYSNLASLQYDYVTR